MVIKNFPIKQIKSLIKISKFLIKKYKIKKKNILGHSDIAPLRKIRSRRKISLEIFHKNKIGIWHNLNSKKIKSLRKKI